MNVDDAARVFIDYQGLNSLEVPSQDDEIDPELAEQAEELGAVVRRIEMSDINGSCGGANEGGTIGAVRSHEHDLGHSLTREIVEVLDDCLEI